MGAVVALSLALGAAGGYVLVTGGHGVLGPTEVGASSVAEGIAVLPFDTRSDELSIYREGMVDLLSASFDGVGGYRTIDSRTVLARWNEQVGDVARADLDAALRAAGQTGARYAILGSMIPAGSIVRVQVDIYDVSDGSAVGHASIDGTAEDILDLVDGLSVEIARELLGAAGEEAAGERRLASITTHSVDALKDYLEGERLYRLGAFEASAARSIGRSPRTAPSRWRMPARRPCWVGWPMAHSGRRRRGSRPSNGWIAGRHVRPRLRAPGRCTTRVILRPSRSSRNTRGVTRTTPRPGTTSATAGTT